MNYCKLSQSVLAMIVEEGTKEVSLVLQQQTTFFERLQNEPFWIRNIDEHKQGVTKTNGDCCFNLASTERDEFPTTFIVDSINEI
jgi:hypothetical protein